MLEPGTFSTKAIDDNSKEAKAGSNVQSPYVEFTNRLKGLHSKILDTRRGVGDPENIAIFIEKITFISKIDFFFQKFNFF